jgi:maltose-binding protein MalE
MAYFAAQPAGLDLYARQLASIQGGTYGIPFAGNGMVMIYKQKVFAKPPRTWDAFFKRESTFAVSSRTA